jgi:hypothetical protein
VWCRTFRARAARAANYLYNFAPRDGRRSECSSAIVPLLGLLGGANVQFDPRKFIWLDSPRAQNDANILIVRKDAPVSTSESPGAFAAGAGR